MAKTILHIEPPAAARAYKASALNSVRKAANMCGVAGGLAGAWIGDMALKALADGIDAGRAAFGAVLIAAALWVSFRKSKEADRMGDILLRVEGADHG